LTQWLRENNIPYEELDSKYDPAIVEKVLDGKRNIEEGNFIKFTPEMLWK
jgi:(2Fe-2S) ferredoxin